MWGTPTNFVHVQSGGIKAYMVTARNRLSIGPDIPTAAEAGLPALTYSPWWTMFSPKGTPANIIEKLNSAGMVALADAAVRQRLESIGMEIFPPSEQTPKSLGLLVRSDIEKWWPIIKAANIKSE